MSALEEAVAGLVFYAGVACLVAAAFRVSDTLGLAALGVALMALGASAALARVDPTRKTGGDG